MNKDLFVGVDRYTAATIWASCEIPIRDIGDRIRFNQINYKNWKKKL